MRRSEVKAVEPGDQEHLTRAIRSAVATVESQNLDCFRYDDVLLRGAVERRIYYEAVIDPTRLEVLCRAGAKRANFLKWLPAQVGSNLIPEMLVLCKAWARLFYYGVFRAVRGHNPGVNLNRPEFIFCVVHPRFVGFFLPIIEKLGRHRCALLCEGNPRIVEEADRHGLVILSQPFSRFRAGCLGRPPRALFSVYSITVVQLLKAIGALDLWRPRVVVFAEAASFQEEVVARAARSLGIATVRVQHGRAGVLSPGYYDMPYDKMLMWGQGFIDRLTPTSPNCNYVVTGSPLFDDPLANQLDQLPNIFQNDKPVVTIISQPQCASILPQDYEALVLIVDQILRRSSKINILVRLHPADFAINFSRLAEQWPQRIRVTQAKDYKLKDILSQSTVVVGLYSTVLSEAVAFGVVPVILRLAERHRVFPSPEDAGAAVLATNPQTAVDAICKLATDPAARVGYRDNMENFCRRYFGQMDGSAVARVTENIENAEFCLRSDDRKLSVP